ncbi:DUF2189 domain-containing protein [Parvibium lacunae]|uniref:DUF2189 domain-containing protein n=1 Tax=Parvibium lacunae TaxID=1888893 RepID=A0A368L584_9BURK|nr:DUF2189 domain-containing protein [Parvibium lacunae]RCS58582.1 DUF2189 domain-containing protein [Parvibium lacunae]
MNDILNVPTTPNLEPSLPTAQEIAPLAAIGWLRSGWQDLLATRGVGVFYGALFTLMGYAIQGIYATRWQLTMALTAGFFLLGPFLCAGVYELSRQRERGERVNLLSSLLCWRRNLPALAFFAVILTFVMIVWARISVVIFALFSNTDFPTLQSLIGQIISLDNLEFIGVWTAVGAVIATLVFAISVVTVPLLLDRQSDTLIAMFASARALWQNLLALYVWAVLIVLLIGFSLVYFLPALLVTAPLVGHATWHAYRALLAQ